MNVNEELFFALKQSHSLLRDSLNMYLEAYSLLLNEIVKECSDNQPLSNIYHTCDSILMNVVFIEQTSAKKFDLIHHSFSHDDELILAFQKLTQYKNSDEDLVERTRKILSEHMNKRRTKIISTSKSSPPWLNKPLNKKQ